MSWILNQTYNTPHGKIAKGAVAEQRSPFHPDEYRFYSDDKSLIYEVEVSYMRLHPDWFLFVVDKPVSFAACNINDKIKVKLTDKGRQLLRLNGYENKEDENGWTTFTMWDFMRVCGPHLSIGLHLICKPTVLIEVKN